MKLQSVNQLLEKQLQSDPLRDYFTLWDDISHSDVEALKEALELASREEDIQQFLQSNPKFLIQHLGGGHGRWVLPKIRLGSEHVTDFVIGAKNSLGFEWQAVELESPLRPMFNKNGDPSQYLNHAIRQIRDWRSWLLANQSYAARPKTEGGLGLAQINGNIPGLILIGRRSLLHDGVQERRRQMAHELNIRIHTYDYLIEALEGRLQGDAVWVVEGDEQ